MAAAFAPKARAGWSISVTFGTPVVYAPPVVVAPAPPPMCGPPPVMVAPAPVVCVPAPVYVPVRPAPVCQPVKFVPPGHLRKDDRWDDERRDRNCRGYDRHDRGKHGRGDGNKHGRH